MELLFYVGMFVLRGLELDAAIVVALTAVLLLAKAVSRAVERPTMAWIRHAWRHACLRAPAQADAGLARPTPHADGSGGGCAGRARPGTPPALYQARIGALAQALQHGGQPALVLMALSTVCQSPPSQGVRDAIVSLALQNPKLRIGPDTDSISGPAMRRDGCPFSRAGLEAAPEAWPVSSPARYKPADAGGRVRFSMPGAGLAPGSGGRPTPLTHNETMPLSPVGRLLAHHHRRRPAAAAGSLLLT